MYNHNFINPDDANGHTQGADGHASHLKVYFRNKRGKNYFILILVFISIIIGVYKGSFQDHLWFSEFLTLCKQKGKNALSVLFEILATYNGTGKQGI